MKTQVVVIVDDPAAVSVGEVHQRVVFALRQQGWDVLDSYVRAGKNCPDNSPCLRDRALED